MKLGVGPFTCQRPPYDDRSMEQVYAEMLDLSRVAERVGLDSVWVSEHHFVDDGYMSGPLAALAAIAGATEEITVGTSVSLAPLHHPVRIAEDGATIDLVSGGRLVFGIGLGYRDVEFEAMGVDKDERTGRVEDAARFLRAAWSEGPLDYESDYADVSPDRSVTPKPESVPPVVFAGGAKPAVRRAARLGDGWIALPTESPDGVRLRREDIESVRDDGLDGFTVYPGARGFVADSKEEAWETIKDGLFHMRRKYGEFGLPGSDAFLEADSIGGLPDETVARMKEEAVYGTPEDVIGELEAYRDAAGDDAHFVFRVFIPGVDAEPLTKCLELLGEEVRPHFA